jgi:YHS domain-containing protein
MFRAIVVSLILTIALRVILSTYSAFMEGLRGSSSGSRESRGPRGAAPSQPVQMARDPVCGTFVVPERAVSVAVGRERVYFCSENCRNAYRARTA